MNAMVEISDGWRLAKILIAWCRWFDGDYAFGYSW